MHIIFEALFYTPEAKEQIDNGVPSSKFKEAKFSQYKPIGIKKSRIESAVPCLDYKDHTLITTYSGDSWVVRVSINNYFRLIDHIEAGKTICRLNN